MKPLMLAMLVLLLAPAPSAAARGCDDPPSLTLRSCCEAPARWADRKDPDEVVRAIDNEDGGVTLVITDRVVALQLSDRSMRKVRHELKHKEDEEEDNAIAQAVKTAILSGVRSLLDHSVECRIRDLRSVEYRGGQLVMTTVDGDRIFDRIECDGQDVLASFSEHDATAFAAEFRRLKHR